MNNARDVDRTVMIGGRMWLAPPSPREWDALMLMVDAPNNPELADLMGVGVRTSKTYTDALRHKLRVNERRHLVSIAAEYQRNRVVRP